MKYFHGISPLQISPSLFQLDLHLCKGFISPLSSLTHSLSLLGISAPQPAWAKLIGVKNGRSEAPATSHHIRCADSTYFPCPTFQYEVWLLLLVLMTGTSCMQGSTKPFGSFPVAPAVHRPFVRGRHQSAQAQDSHPIAAVHRDSPVAHFLGSEGSRSLGSSGRRRQVTWLCRGKHDCFVFRGGVLEGMDKVSWELSFAKYTFGGPNDRWSCVNWSTDGMELGSRVIGTKNEVHDQGSAGAGLTIPRCVVQAPVWGLDSRVAVESVAFLQCRSGEAQL